MAYALIVSLKRTLDPLLDSAQSIVQIHKPELKLIYDDLCYIKSFFDGMNSLRDRNSVEELERDMRGDLEDTQDLIEAYLTKLAQSETQSDGDESSISQFAEKLVKVKDKLKAKKDEIAVLKAKKDEILKAKEEFLKSQEEDGQQSPDHFGADGVISSKIGMEKNKKTVGLEGEVSSLLDLLLSENSRRTLISIGGMAGIGKTTLATEVYLHPLVEHRFNIRMFVSVGMEYQLGELLSCLLGQLVFMKMKNLMVDELGVHLYKSLFARRYLIVLDDMWNLKAWEDIQRFFPDNGNGSRIICTSRLNGEVCDALSDRKLQKRFLDEEESWELLCMIAFPDMQMCPLELEEIGRSITRYLEGLPAAIVEIGKVLSNSPPTLESWREITRNMSMILETMTSTFVSPSYAQLPQHLKACFLYLGLLQFSYNIPTSQLFRLWVAEGLVKPIAGKRLELIAEEYLHNLVSRNLVVVHELSSTGKIKTCRFHGLFQNFCANEARKEKLFHIIEWDFPGTENLRRLGVHSNNVFGGFREVLDWMALFSSARSLLVVGPQHQHPVKLSLRFPWLRVLDALPLIFHRFPDEVTQLVRLRYLAIRCNGGLPSSISTLLNLEVLIIYPTQIIKSSVFVFLPLEIWKLHKLKHLVCMGFDLPDPTLGYYSHLPSLMNLQTLSGVSTHSCTEAVLEKMPKLIKLVLWSHPTHQAAEISCLNAVFTYLHELESLKCVITNPTLVSRAPSYHISFPLSLRKLTLSGCGFLWEKDMTIISQLPLLQVLKLRCRAFCGPKWELCEGGFMQLELLLLEDLDIEHFEADESHLPVLQKLFIRRCYKLHEIPNGIAYIPTLRRIEVEDCSTSATQSARLIREEHVEMGDDTLQFWIYSSWHSRW